MAEESVMPNSNYPSENPNKSIKCGSCRYFRDGFRGETCVKTREVDSETQACIEWVEYSPSPIDYMREDKVLKDIIKISRKYRKDSGYLKELLDEYRSAMDKYKPPRHYRSDADLEVLAQGFELVQTYKDRINEIRVRQSILESDIEELIDAAEKHIMSVFKDFFSGVKTEKMRTSLMGQVLIELHSVHRDVQKVIKIANMRHSNLSDTHFSYNSIKEVALTLWDNHRKRKIS